MRIGLGCVDLGSVSAGHGFRADVRLVEEAVERGVRVFDTADAYGNGNSERVVGRGVRRRRDEVTIATKGGYVGRERSRAEVAARRAAKGAIDRVRQVRSGGDRDGGGDGGEAGGAGQGSYEAQDFSPAHLRAAIDASLRRLGTDRIDVYQFHGPRRVLPAIVAELTDLVGAGKVGRFGVGAESVEVAAGWTTVEGIEVVQLPFGMLDPEAATTVVPLVGDRPVELWARGVFAGGILAAAVRDPQSVAAHPKRALVADLLDLARRAGVDPFAMALGYVRAEPAFSTVLVGTSSSAHLARNVALADAPPPPGDLLAEVRAVIATHRPQEPDG